MPSNLVPGTQQYGELDPAIGLTASITQDPFSPVEAGRTAAKSKYTTTASSGNPIGGNLTVGAVATVTLVGKVSVKADGDQTGSATSSRNGSGCTITYTVASNVASGTTVVAKGTGYAVGDTITISDDPGVTYTVATIS